MTKRLIRFENSSRPMVLRCVAAGEKVSTVIIEAGKEFLIEMGRAAQFAFMREIPKGAYQGIEVDEIMLIQADWVECGFVAIGAGGMEIVDKETSRWVKK